MLHCPAPNVMNYLDLISGEQQNLTSLSILCNSCYQHITRIVKDIKVFEDTAPAVERDELEKIMSEINDEVTSIDKGRKTWEEGDLFRFAFLGAAKTLCLKMLKDDSTRTAPKLHG